MKADPKVVAAASPKKLVDSTAGRKAQAYKYRVSATGTDGTKGTASAEKSINYASKPGKPGQPTLDTVKKPTASKVVINWSAATANGFAVTKYRVNWGTSETDLSNLVEVGTKVTWDHDVSANTNMLFYYQVDAMNTVGWGDKSPMLKNVLASDGPAQTTLRVDSANNDEVKLAWDEITSEAALNGNKKIKGWKIERGFNEKVFEKLIEEIADPLVKMKDRKYNDNTKGTADGNLYYRIAGIGDGTGSSTNYGPYSKSVKAVSVSSTATGIPAGFKQDAFSTK